MITELTYGNILKGYSLIIIIDFLSTLSTTLKLQYETTEFIYLDKNKI